MGQEMITVRGAREHNLKNITVEIPRDEMVVITGLSGSGKSSLAYDTIFAEGQRRYVESLSAYARQFLGQMEKPDVDQIDGLSPAISIDQRGMSHNPRSTVGTVTETYDYLRLLYARVGTPHCPECGRQVSQQSAQEIVDALLRLSSGTRVQVLAPLIRDRKGHHQAVFDDVKKAGFVRVRVDGRIYDIGEEIELDRYKNHTIEAIVDRLVIPDKDDPTLKATEVDSFRVRLADSVETALHLGAGHLIVNDVTDDENPRDLLFSEHFACPYCGISLPEIEPRTFSFNSPHGACPECQGLGMRPEVDPDLIIPNFELSVEQDAIVPWSGAREREDGYYTQLLQSVGRHFDIPLDVPVRELTQSQRQLILYGSGDERINIMYRNRQGRWRNYDTTYEGVIPNLRRRYHETTSDYVRAKIEGYMTPRSCPACGGARLRAESLGVTVGDLSITGVASMPVVNTLEWVEELQRKDGPLGKRQQTIAFQILKEIHARLRFMADVGLDYLTLDRAAATLAGGEAQRIRLATQIGSQLMGVLYVLDEPTIGLHQRDNDRLLRTLEGMRDLGNTLLIVEHDDATIRAADWIIDLGPGAGELGGEVVFEGTPQEILSDANSITGAYLSGRRRIEVPPQRREGNGKIGMDPRGARKQPEKYRRSAPDGEICVYHGRFRVRKKHAAH